MVLLNWDQTLFDGQHASLGKQRQAGEAAASGTANNQEINAARENIRVRLAN
jgi:hypothetical protein